MLKSAYRNTILHLHQISDAWSLSKVSTSVAAVAYYGIFSIAPVIVIAISITGIFINRQSAQMSIIGQVGAMFGQGGADLVGNLIRSNASTQTGITLTVASFIILLIGATGIFSQMQTSLDAIFDPFPAKNPRRGWGIIRRRLISLGLILTAGFLILASIVLSAFVIAVSYYVSRHVPETQFLATVAEYVISFALISFFFALAYKILPTKRLHWKPALVGGASTGVLFTVSKYLLGLYFSSSQAFTTYGAAASLVVIVIWIYYMAEIFFLGAVLVRLYVVPKHAELK